MRLEIELWQIAIGLLLLVVVVQYAHRCKQENQLIRTLFHQMSRWATASMQDENAIVRVLHANYAVGYMMAVQAIASDEKIGSVMGAPNIRELFQEVQTVQNEATLRLVQSCPGIAPTNQLARYGSEGI